MPINTGLISSRVKFAIRHIPSGYYLPEPKGRGGRGGSWVEPVDANHELPRLFNTLRGAKIALTAYCKGQHEGEYEYDGGWNTYCIGYSLVRNSQRKRGDFEIVQITFHAGETHQ